MVLRQICAPALIYLIFSITQVSIDIVKGAHNTALIKIWVAFVFTVLLNYLCMSGLNIVSWLIVFIPFILMTVIVSMLLFMFGLDPSSGKLAIAYDKRAPKKLDSQELIRRRRERKRHHRLDRFTAEEHAKVRKYEDSSRINTGYDQSNISKDQRQVLTDDVQDRTPLTRDPLQSTINSNRK